jgi:hypothetical protein
MRTPAPEPRLICRVEATFSVRGHGLVLCPEADLPEGVKIRVGDPVTLRLPDGHALETRIKAIELITPNPKHIAPIILEGIVEKSEAPIGSEVWTRPAP